jgi:hypothetical protein
LRFPGRFLAMHFFMPADFFPMIEVVRGEHTEDAALALAVAAVKTGRAGADCAATGGEWISDQPPSALNPPRGLSPARIGDRDGGNDRRRGQTPPGTADVHHRIARAEGFWRVSRCTRRRSVPSSRPCHIRACRIRCCKGWSPAATSASEAVEGFYDWQGRDTPRRSDGRAIACKGCSRIWRRTPSNEHQKGIGTGSDELWRSRLCRVPETSFAKSMATRVRC